MPGGVAAVTKDICHCTGSVQGQLTTVRNCGEVEMFGMKAINQNFIHYEVTTALQSMNACLCSAQNLFVPSTENPLKLEIHKTVILPAEVRSVATRH